MTSMTKELDHIYVDTEVFFKSHRTQSGRLLKFMPLSQTYPYTYAARESFGLSESRHLALENASASTVAPWKRNRQTVQQLTFNGQHTAYYSRIRWHLLRLLQCRFPSVQQVNLWHVIMDEWDDGCVGRDDEDGFYQVTEMQAYLTRDVVRLPISFKDCVMPAFPDFDRHVEFWSREIGEAKELLGRLRDGFTPVPDVTWGSVEEIAALYGSLSQMAWWYPDEQLEWLARWAPCLNGNKQVLSGPRSWQAYYASFDDEPPMTVMCDVHEQFCDHLDVTFYQQLTGQARNLVAAYLLELNPPGMSPPPVPFRFGKFHLRKGKPARFSLMPYGKERHLNSSAHVVRS